LVAVDSGQEAVVPAGQVMVCHLVRAAGQEHRWAHPAAFELSFVPQGRTRQRGDGHGRGPFGIGRKAAGDAGLVMVLQEAD
jgi:hypothetical protein